MYTIIDEKTGQELYAKFDNFCLINEVAIQELRTEEMENPYFNFENKTFYDKK